MVWMYLETALLHAGAAVSPVYGVHLVGASLSVVHLSWCVCQAVRPAC